MELSMHQHLQQQLLIGTLQHDLRGKKIVWVREVVYGSIMPLFSNICKKSLEQQCSLFFQRPHPFGLFFFLVTTHFLPMSYSFRASSLIRWRLLLLKRKGLVVLLNLASKVFKSTSLEILHWDLVMGAIAAPPFPGSSSSSSVSLLEFDKKHTRERNHPIDNNNNCCHRPLSAHTHSHHPITTLSVVKFPTATHKTHKSRIYITNPHSFHHKATQLHNTVQSNVLWKIAHLYISKQNSRLEISIPTCMHTGNNLMTSNSTSSYKQKKHVLQEKILSTAKDCKKHFECASCLIGTVTDPNSSSKIQHTMKTKRSNQKNAKKKKTLAIKESKTLEAIALDT